MIPAGSGAKRPAFAAHESARASIAADEAAVPGMALLARDGKLRPALAGRGTG
jgi:hypothetical protein